MKRKIGILLLILVNSLIIWIIVLGIIFSFGIVVQSFDFVRGPEIVNYIVSTLLLKFTLVFTLSILLNYLIIKILINARKPIVKSLIIALFEVLIFFPILISNRNNFIKNQLVSTSLNKYLDIGAVVQTFVISQKDTICINKQKEFLSKIGEAKSKRGIWKFGKKKKIVFIYRNGMKDSIYTNGNIFGEYKKLWFFTDYNVIDQFLAPVNSKR